MILGRPPQSDDRFYSFAQFRAVTEGKLWGPYQKGSNERGNRDFRKYYPKGTNFDEVTAQEVREAQRKVNLHPMKLHNWRSPSAVAAEFTLACAA